MLQPVSPAGVAPSEKGAPGPGEARLLASGALAQGIAQASGLLALLVIVTVLARRLSVAELGAYGLVASLAGYLLVLRNSVASSAVRAMASALDRDERGLVFSAAAALYVLVGLVTGLLVAGAALAIGSLLLEGSLRADARVGGAGLGVVTGLGIAVSVNLDALRADRLFVRGAVTEMAAVGLYLVVMLSLIFGGADLAWVIAASGAMPLLSGVLSALVARRAGLPVSFSAAGVTRERSMRIVPTAGWVLVVELSNLAMYAFSRVILGAYRSPAAVGRYEGPVRAHNLLYSLSGALAVPVVPTASRYVAGAEHRRLRQLALRGTRYTLALFVPVCVTLMALAEPILTVWRGDRYAGGASALTILVSYWILMGGLIVTPGFLVGVGRARQAGLVFAGTAVFNLVLTLVLTPELGLEGPALGTAIPFLCAFPLLLRVGLSAARTSVTELARVAWLPAYSLGVALAGVLAGLRALLEPDSLLVVVVLAGGGVLAYWAAFYAFVLSGHERELVRRMLSRSG